jgi:hypothetical protein
MKHLSLWAMHFHCTLSLRGKIAGLEADVRGQLNKMMKCYRDFMSGMCGKYM